MWERGREGESERVKEKETTEGLCGCVCVHVRERKRQRGEKTEGKVAGKAKVTFIKALTLCTSH